MRLHRVTVLAAGVFGLPITLNERRGLLDVLEGDVVAEPTLAVTPTPPAIPSPGASSPAGVTTIGELTAAILGDQSTMAIAGAGAQPTPPTTNILGSVAISHTSFDGTKTRHAQGETTGPHSTSEPGPTNSVTLVAAVNKEVSATPPGELAQWKVIGISIICVTFVAIIIMAVTFFETWSAFVRDVAGCGGCRKGRDTGMQNGMENLSPDWNRRTWEFKLANEDGHRYPTLTSMDSMTKV